MLGRIHTSARISRIRGARTGYTASVERKVSRTVPSLGPDAGRRGPNDGDGMTTNVTRLLSAATLAAVLVPAAASAAGAADLPNPKVTSDGSNSTIVVHAHRTGGTFTPSGGSPDQDLLPDGRPATSATGSPSSTTSFRTGRRSAPTAGAARTIKGAASATCDATLSFAGGSLHSGGPSPQSSGPYSVPIYRVHRRLLRGHRDGSTWFPAAAPMGSTASDVTLTFAVPAAASSAAPTSTGSSSPFERGRDWVPANGQQPGDDRGARAVPRPEQVRPLPPMTAG